MQGVRRFVSVGDQLVRRAVAGACGVAPQAAQAFSPAPAAGGAAAARRTVFFDVDDNSQVDHAFKKLNRKLNMEGVLLESRIRTRHTKKCEQKRIDQRSTAKRLARREVGRKIRWIMRRRERGF
uniref:Mitochondrial ribosomal protein S21 n=1 Tax=Chloropicon laureae TaxID=464258 RepID=A0A7S2Z7D5_9CHLO|mmetsp:Transcript_17090/g.34945  ORF Transcript_17090/g.34945 Transcript_17090/m.34945 type:complete len:124 (-) Transcript_17090:104-475(-)